MADQLKLLIYDSLFYPKVVLSDCGSLALGLLGSDLLPFIVRVVFFWWGDNSVGACSTILGCFSLNWARDQDTLLYAAISRLLLLLLLLGLKLFLGLNFGPPFT